MSEWQETTLKDISLKMTSGGTPSTKNASFFDGEIPWLNTKEVKNCRIHNTEKFISEEGLKHSSAKWIEKESVIVAMYGETAGKVAMNLIPLTTNQACCNITLNEKANPYFIFYNILSRYAEIKNQASGAAQQNLNVGGIGQIVIDLPPLPEQRAIAEVLSSLDDKIDLLHRQNQTLEALAETLFRQWFIEEADPAWEEVTVGDVAKTNLRTVKTDYPYTQIQYLDTGSITKGKIESLQPYELKDAPSRAKRLVEHNDIIISTVRPNHKHYGFIKNPQADLVVSTGFCVITCFGIDPHFMYCLMTQEEMTEYLSIVAEASTSTYPSLKPSDIELVEFQLPPKDLLDKFSAIAMDSWKKIENNYAQIRHLEKTRDELLPKLMSGEIRVQYDDLLQMEGV